MRRQAAGTILTHAIGWTLFLSLPLLFVSGQGEGQRATTIIFSLPYWFFFFCYAFLFYSHTYFIFPQWFRPSRYAWYAAALLLLFLFIYRMQPFEQVVSLVHGGHRPFARGGPRPFPGGQPPFGGQRPPERRFVDIISISLFILTIALSIALILARRDRISRQRAMKAETEKAQAELSFLKAQINPHFLFNTLNNIYAMAVSVHPNTAPSIMKLSNILRYVTEDVSHDLVPLSREINCLQDYIGLQRLRLTRHTSIELDIAGDPLPWQIAPMVLITLVENAFKFGVSSHEDSSIDVSLDCGDQEMVFRCRNRRFGSRAEEGAGVGLTNTRQRLEHMFDGRHTLQVDTDAEYFTVILSLQKSKP